MKFWQLPIQVRSLTPWDLGDLSADLKKKMMILIYDQGHSPEPPRWYGVVLS
jgi:hypothetical protein